MLLEASTCERLHYFRRSKRRPFSTTVARQNAHVLLECCAARGPPAGTLRPCPIAHHPRPAAARARPPPCRRLEASAQTATVEQLVESFGLWERPDAPAQRPRLLLNMVSTADGRATLSGRSGSISGAADRALFHALRAPVDGVLVGAGTLRTERYGRIIPDPSVRALRARARAARGAAGLHRLGPPGDRPGAAPAAGARARASRS